MNNEENNNQNQTNETTKVVKKHHGPLYWVIVVAGVAFIVSASINIGEKLGRLSSGETNSGTKTESTSNSNVQTDSNMLSNSSEGSNSNVESNNNVETNELTDAQKTDLSKLLATMFGANYDGSKLIKGQNFSYFFTGNLDETAKSYIITRITNSTTTKIDKSTFKFNENVEQSEIDNQNGEFQVINKGDYDTNYKKVFGTTPTSYPRTPACPSYVFDTNSQRYVSIGGCGISTISNALIYIDDIKLEGNNAVISTYVGSIVYDLDNTQKTYNNYYNGSDTNAKTINTTTITESNKTQFTKYNFVFEKATDGNYYYKTTQKAN